MIEEVYSFLIPTYVKLLKNLKKHYKIISLKNVSRAKPPYLILRHDIDFSFEASASMAEIEHNLGVESTYCVLFSSKHYNLYEKKTLKHLRNIGKMGHEVALHYDLEAYKLYNQKLETVLNHELKSLELLTGSPVRSIAMHQPWREPFDPFKNISNIINSANPQLAELYVTDSYRAWYREYLLKLFSLTYGKVQLVIHPSLWTDKNTTWKEILERYDESDLFELWKGSDKIKETRIIVKNMKNTLGCQINAQG